jgi:hypothetical protein
MMNKIFVPFDGVNPGESYDVKINNKYDATVNVKSKNNNILTVYLTPEIGEYEIGGDENISINENNRNNGIIENNEQLKFVVEFFKKIPTTTKKTNTTEIKYSSQGGKSQRRRRPVTATKKNRSRKYHKLAKFLKTHDYSRRRRRFR